MFALTNVLHFLSHKLTRLRRGRLTFSCVFSRPFDCLFLWHIQLKRREDSQRMRLLIRRIRAGSVHGTFRRAQQSVHRAPVGRFLESVNESAKALGEKLASNLPVTGNARRGHIMA